MFLTSEVPLYTTGGREDRGDGVQGWLLNILQVRFRAKSAHPKISVDFYVDATARIWHGLSDACHNLTSTVL